MKLVSKIQNHPALSHLPVAGILLDLALLCWAALLSVTAPLIIANLRFIIPWVWIPQCMTLYAVVLGPDLPQEVKQGMALLRTILLMIGMGFLAVMGGVWVLISGMLLGVLFVLVGLFSTVVVACAAGKVGAFLRRNPAVLRWQGKVVGGVYCALGIRLALQER